MTTLTAQTKPGADLALMDMYPGDIESFVWEGRGVYELVGLSDVYTDEQISSLPSHPSWNLFSYGFHTMVWSSIDRMFLEEGL